MTTKSRRIFLRVVASLALLCFLMVFVHDAHADDSAASSQPVKASSLPAVFSSQEKPPSKTIVVGNKDTRRYHLPGMFFYDKVKKHHRVYFESEQQAIDNGYYKAGTRKGAAKSAPEGKAVIEKRTSPAAVASAASEHGPLENLSVQEKGLEKKTKDCPRVALNAPTPNALTKTAQAPLLTLDESIAIALKNSLVINIAREGAKGAGAKKREAITGFLPKLTTSYNYTRLNEEPSLYFPGLPPIPAGHLTTGTVNNYNWVFEARQPLYAGGGILANYQASKIAEEAAYIEEKAKSQDVIQDVKIAYYNILRTQRLKNTASQAVEMLNAHRDIAENFYRVGLIAKNDLLQAEVELANGKQSLVRAQYAVNLAKSRFNTVLKREILLPVEIVDILDYKPFKQSFQECLEIARQHRPELKFAALKAEQAGKMVRVAQSEFYPTINLVGNYSRFGDTLSVSGTEYQDMESWRVMAVANWNIWEWGKTKYRVDAGKAAENQAIDQAKELGDQIAMEIENAYLVLQEAESQIAVSQKVIEQAEENFRMSEARYKERVARATEVIDAQTLLTKAKSEYANALGDYNISHVRLERAMGIIDQR